MKRPNSFHYNVDTKTWDNDFSGEGVYEDYEGWHYVAFVQGSLIGFGPFDTEEEARRLYIEEVHANREWEERISSDE